MRSLFTYLLLLASLGSLHAQTAPNKYWIAFTDKANSPYSIENPEAFLSDEALERRRAQGIGVSEEDLPVNPDYINAVLELGAIEYWHQSAWFNAITIKTLEPELLEAIQNLPFVASTRAVRTFKSDLPAASLEKATTNSFTGSEGYGMAWRQVEMLNGHLLHAAGFEAVGMRIAVLDAGFSRVHQLPVFERLRSEGRITQVRDYVLLGNEVNFGSMHGSSVLSTMGGWLDEGFKGTAPEAHYYLFRTEDTGSEFVIEEDNWVAAIEHAERMGIHIANSSLGYSYFDDPEQSYTPSDMDGSTSRISRAATIAASKGMIIVTSAGNSGSSDWRIITSPGDARDVLTVGAVDSLGIHAPFSSYGPTADGRIKPDIVAMGRASAVARPDSTIGRSNGTSFSSPIVCGLTACLWQAHPNKSAAEIREAIVASASLFTAPNDSMGHGIPDFWQAHQLLRDRPVRLDREALIYPNPTYGRVYIEWSTEEAVNGDALPRYFLLNPRGQRVMEGELNAIGNRALGVFDLPVGCSAGTYLVELRWGAQVAREKLQVQ